MFDRTFGRNIAALGEVAERFKAAARKAVMRSRDRIGGSNPFPLRHTGVLEDISGFPAFRESLLHPPPTE